MRTPEEIREHVENWESEDEILRCDKCGTEIMGDYYYANIEEYGDKWCEDCYNEAYEEWLGEHRRVL